MRFHGFFAIAILAATSLTADGRRFLPDDPVRLDVDDLPIDEPAESAVSKAYDFLENTFAKRGGLPGPARNTNTLGEVPDSSWFVNRIGSRSMSLEELARGPNRGAGRDGEGPWTILSLKTEGITPGFIIRDAKRQKYVIKLDPAGFPQMTTSAEVISTKFFHAFGYNVPENYLAFLEPDRLRIDESAVVVDGSGRRRPLRPRDVDRVIEKSPRRPDGRLQVVASLWLPGKPIGPFKFFGTREGDSNDIFAHEDRRELRGLRLFAAWLNHNDSDAANTLDVFVPRRGGGFVKHYLIDFGTTLGSGGFEPHSRRAGNEHYLEWGPVLKSSLSLGLWDRPWRKVPYREFPSIGRFESAHFDPLRWRPDYPNPAFDRMDAEDAFWAASIVARFTDERVAAIVATGEILDRDAEAHLLEAIRERRDKILRHYLRASNPLVDFTLDEARGALAFENLGALWGLGAVESYRYQWFGFDSRKSLESLGPPQSTSLSAIPLPRDPAAYWMVRIETLSPDARSWGHPVDVYVRNGASKKVVGVERNLR